MCGVAGYTVRNKKNAAEAFWLFELLMAECQVRGRHASGAAWWDGVGVRSIKAPLPAKQLMTGAKWLDLKSAPPLNIIGHTRYSTSGDWHNNENNQPLVAGEHAIVHNGLVSMADKPGLEKAYGVKLRTSNDTEVLLKQVARHGIAKGFAKVAEVHPPIFACAFLQGPRLYVVRDHIRPLWLFDVEELGMIGFASTADIIKRAMKKAKKSHTVWSLDPYTVKLLVDRGASTQDVLRHSKLPEKRWSRPNIKHPMMSNARAPKAPLVLEAQSQAQSRLFDHRKHLRESFKQYCVGAISSWEIDPNYPLMNYLFKRYELSKSQEYWACFLYGTFYHPGSVFYVMQEFPEFEKVDLKRLKKWHAANWHQLRYNTDRKYEKGHFVEMFESYRDMIGAQQPDAQEEFFLARLAQADTDQSRFRMVEHALRQLWHFGRYATYIYTEALHRCMGMPIKADTMFLKEAESSRTGLAYVLGWDAERVAEGKLSTEEWATFLGQGERLMKEIQEEYPKLGMDHWFMESCLCAYKGFFRRTKGRYLGYYYDRMYDEMTQMEGLELTSGIEWGVLKQFRQETVIPEYLGENAEPPRLKVHKTYEHVLRDEGRMIGLLPIVRRGLLNR